MDSVLADNALADSSLYVIIALLPLSALMLVSQVNPYHALVIRGILGAVAALVYVILGAADVALTEALVGTMLAITLYAVAVRSSMSMRLGVLEDESSEASEAMDAEDRHRLEPFMYELRTFLRNHHMRLERVTYLNRRALNQALIDKDVHAICVRVGRSHLDETALHRPSLSVSSSSHSSLSPSPIAAEDDQSVVHTTVRIRRLYELMQAELSSSSLTALTYVNVSDGKVSDAMALDMKIPEFAEEQP